MRVILQLSALFVVLLLGSPAFAQTTDGGPDPATVRVRIGPLWMNPSISLPNIGIDTNVFNDPPTVTPSRDFTLTAAPKADMWVRMGRTWLSGTVSEELVWYETYETERSANHLLAVGWKAPLNRLVLSTGANWLSTRARPGYEIDARVRHKEPTYTASGEVRAFTKTFIGARGSWRKVSYEDAVYEGVNLQEELDRKVIGLALTVRHELTPLTTVTFSGGRSEETFTSDSRNSKSDEYAVSFNFDPAALLKGSATFGFLNYRPESADLPGYRGATVDVNLAYALLGSTRFSGTISRAIESSFDNAQPYYLQTGGSLSVAQRIGGPFDVVGRMSAHRLNYTSRDSASPEVTDRTDRVQSFGGGVGFRMAGDLRLGFNADKERRTSILEDREYEGLRYGASLTYGL